MSRAMPTTNLRMTREEFLAWFPDDGVHRELLRGEVIVNQPTARHQAVLVDLTLELGIWCRGGADRGLLLLPVDTDISDDTILAPDLQWYAAGRTMNDMDSRPQPCGDIVVEIRSPSTWHYDVGAKRTAYEQVGAQEYWLVDPGSRTTVILARSTRAAPTFDISCEVDHTQTLTSPLLPGFAVDVAALLPA